MRSPTIKSIIRGKKVEIPIDVLTIRMPSEPLYEWIRKLMRLVDFTDRDLMNFCNLTDYEYEKLRTISAREPEEIFEFIDRIYNFIRCFHFHDGSVLQYQELIDYVYLSTVGPLSGRHKYLILYHYCEVPRQMFLENQKLIRDKDD